MSEKNIKCSKLIEKFPSTDINVLKRIFYTNDVREDDKYWDFWWWYKDKIELSAIEFHREYSFITNSQTLIPLCEYLKEQNITFILNDYFKFNPKTDDRYCDPSKDDLQAYLDRQIQDTPDKIRNRALVEMTRSLIKI
jgi:hypothetical protein